MKGTQKIGDFIDLKVLQHLQDNFAKALGMAFITVDYKGRPVVEYSGFTQFCLKARELIACGELCEQCDAHGGLHAAITEQPYIYRCHTGLVDFAIPLIFKGAYVGAVLGGQVCLPDKEVQQLEQIVQTQSNWENKAELVEARQINRKLSYEQLLAAVQLVQDMISTMTNFGVAGKEDLEQKQQELMRERAYRLELEQSVQKQKLRQMENEMDYHILFSGLNATAKLARGEHAADTERFIYDFSDMMRYVLSKDRHIVSLDDEMRYVGSLLRVRQAMLAGAFQYEFSLSPELENTPCPFLLLHSIVEQAIRRASEREQDGKVRIYDMPARQDIIVVVADNGAGMGEAELEAAMQGETEQTGRIEMTMRTLHEKLHTAFGKHYGLELRSTPQGVEGAEVWVRLPRSSYEG